MPSLKPIIQVLVLALIGPWLYDRYVALSSLLSNRPGHLEKLQSFKSHGIKYRERLRNCEDVIMEESLGVAILSCDPGRDRWNTVMGTSLPENPDLDKAGIFLYDYSTPGLDDTSRLTQLTIDEPDLHPLGLSFDAPSSTLYIANHPRNSPPHILILHVDFPSSTSTLVARFQHPLLHAPNSVHAISRHELYVTNDHYVTAATSPLLSQIETFSGLPGGSVVYVDTRFPRAAKVLARVPFANGVVPVNASTLAVASSSKSGLYLFEVKEEGQGLGLKSVVRTPAAVDNLSVDGNGKVLMAGHPFAPALMKVSKRRAECGGQGKSREKGDACECSAPSWVAEWSEAEGLRELYKDDGSEFCSSSTAVRDTRRGVGIVSGLYEEGILVFDA